MPFSLYRRRLSAPLIFLSFALAVFVGAEVIFAQTGQERYQGEVQPDLDQITSELGTAECGGWHFETEVTEATIGDASGVPGRPGQPFDHLESGMAWRQNEGGVGNPLPWDSNRPVDPRFEIANTGYEYPAEAKGYMTACKPFRPWFYEYHPCQRPGPGITGEGEEVYGNGENENSDPLGQGVTWTCDAMQKDLNRRYIFYRWQNTVYPFDIYKAPCFDKDTEEEPQPPSITYVKFEDSRYCCTQHLKGSAYKNSIDCNGEECHTGKAVPDPYRPGFFMIWNYVSYYRHYEGLCSRQPLNDLVTDEDIVYADEPMEVSCYDRYEPYDPKDTESKWYHYRCVVDTTTQDRIPDLPETQQPDYEVVDYGQISKADALWDDPPSDEYHPRKNRGFNEDDLWYTELSDNFSLIQNDPTPGVGTGDLTDHLLNIDTAQVRPYPALTLEAKRSTGGLIRAFDDTVRNEAGEPEEEWRGRRSVIEWWQELQTKMHTYLSPPQIRVVLPTTWSFGLDALEQYRAEPDEERLDTHLQTVEVRLHGGEDTLGAIAKYFESSLLLRIQEEVVPILMPLVDVQDLENAKSQWCNYHSQTTGDENCENATGEIKAIIDSFDQYIEIIDDYRALRGELAYYLANLRSRQLEVVNTMANWLERTVEAYREIHGDNTTLEEHREDWASLQQNWQDFTKQDNTPWCRNDRFTTPIYTFLDIWESRPYTSDRWFPGRPALDGGLDLPYNDLTEDHLPRLPEIDKLQDIVLDFSLLVSNSGAIKLPVLKPIQVRLAPNIFQPPSPTTENPEIPKAPPALPNLQGLIESLRQEVADNLPNVVTTSEPPIITDLLPDIATQNRTELQPKVTTMIEATTEIIEKMRRAYRRFWEVVTTDPESIEEGTEQDCLGVNRDRCIHAEVDLRERFVRMCARPGILLTKDLESIGQWRDPGQEIGDCARDDWACQLERPVFEFDSQGWSLQGPKISDEADYIDEARSAIVEELILEPNRDPDNRLNYLVKPELKLPTFGIQPNLNLKP